MVTLDIPEEGIVHTEDDTKLFFGERDRGSGTLYITENFITWRGSEENDSLTLEYPSISLHAISRDTGNFPHECLYCLLESPVEASEDEQDPEAEVNEIRFVPRNSNNIKSMYDAITHCQELHPDPEDEDSEDEDISGMLQQGHFFTADNMPDTIELSEEGEAVLQRLQQNMQINVEEGDTEVTMNGGGLANGNAPNGISGTNGHSYQFEDADEEME